MCRLRGIIRSAAALAARIAASARSAPPSPCGVVARLRQRARIVGTIRMHAGAATPGRLARCKRSDQPRRLYTPKCRSAGPLVAAAATAPCGDQTTGERGNYLAGGRRSCGFDANRRDRRRYGADPCLNADPRRRFAAWRYRRFCSTMPILKSLVPPDDREDSHATVAD